MMKSLTGKLSAPIICISLVRFNLLKNIFSFLIETSICIIPFNWAIIV